MKTLITGSSSGIGRGIAESLLSNGYEVIGLARGHAKFNPGSENYLTHEIDFKDFNSSSKIAKELVKTHQDLNNLIINAGFGDFKSLEEFSDSQILEMFNVNLLSQIILVKEFIPVLKKNNNAKLIFIGSESSKEGARKGSIYCSTKFALRGFAESLNKELTGQVSIINPGMVKTAFYDEMSFTHGEEKENFIEIQDVVNAVNLILTSKSNFFEIDLFPKKKVIMKK